MRTAELTTVQTSAGCISYRLAADGRTIWSNRVADRPEGHAGAQQRLRAWAAAHGYRVVAGKEVRRSA